MKLGTNEASIAQVQNKQRAFPNARRAADGERGLGGREGDDGGADYEGERPGDGTGRTSRGESTSRGRLCGAAGTSRAREGSHFQGRGAKTL